ncbi:DEAD/DEAH box helicase [Donghicola mangrovi]|uniref:DEAD/DEAH box helicase n=1 Tax=Donghicola mangrovi TaxID=2729614 RepID=A0A850Q932_9RHOB|nr:DEAD/DEAH box helicase [Donghicola mangrovi]NVO23270.1 DEAD/DEAH box helicase [Donghicola mangrovi]
MTFNTLGLDAHILNKLDALGFKAPTPIQAKAIPVALDGHDVLGIAQTGTGKTVAFGAPLVAALEQGRVKPAPKTVRGLVLAPTRELATQIMATLEGLTDTLRLNLIVGGKSINPQINRLARGTDIMVATPGRLIDLIDRSAVDLSKTRFLVLDEADQMLDIGFVHALRRIAPLVSRDRQTMMFSATMPKSISDLAKDFLTDPVRVEVSPPGRAADKVTQCVHFVRKEDKQPLLIELLDKHRDELALVFSRTKHGAEKLMRTLEKVGFAAASIHGNKSQGQRDRALEAFRAGDVRVLVATDVAARGIDIPGVAHVYNYDLPNVPENYVHRIGRTARAGREGAAVAFCTADEMGELKDIEKVLKMSIEVASGTPWDAPAGGAKPKGRGGKPQGRGNPNGGQKPAGAKPQQRRRRPRNGAKGGSPRAAA